jgi:hypothetical protein
MRSMDGAAAGDGVDELAAFRVVARPRRPQPLGQLRSSDLAGRSPGVAHTDHSPDDDDGWGFMREVSPSAPTTECRAMLAMTWSVSARPPVV